jgi:transposase
VGLDIGQKTHYVDVLDTEGNPCVPKATAFAHTREGYDRVQALLHEATSQATPAEVTIGCEATGPYWLN